MTLRRKFVVALATVAALVALLVGFIGFTVTEHGLRGEVDRSLISAATTLSAGGTVAAASQSSTTPTNADGPDRNRQQQGIIQIAQTIAADGTSTILLGAGLPVDATATTLAAGTAVAGDREFKTITLDDKSYRVLTQALGDGLGAIQVARDLGETDRVLSDLALNMGWVGLSVLLAAAVLGWLAARQITRRLTILTAAAEQVGSTGYLDVDIPNRGHDEVTRLSTALQAMLAELARSREDQQRLVQNAGHELRTPLTSLRTNVSVLRRFGELSRGSQIRLLDDVDGETRELTNLVNELVELATDRRDAEEPQPVELTALAERIATLFRRRSGREISVTGEATTVPARRQAVERALSNLLDNALKFDPDGHEPIEIVVGGGTVTVSDRGPGLSPEDVDRIFDRFYRATKARSMPGSGLGLSIVREVASTHGGTVSAAVRPGGGAVIGFSLALAEVLPNSKPNTAGG
jgi:two-component system sensor histidine kinase MprB